MCPRHYHRLVRYGDPLGGGPRKFPQTTDVCLIDDCGKPAKTCNMCGAHYYLARKHGDPRIKLAPWSSRGTTERVFWSYVVFIGGCWQWDGPLDAYGYGEFMANGVRYKAYRYAYEHFVGPIPPGYVIDHLCRIHGCVSPFHLRAVTRGQNADHNRIKTHCPAGHPYDEANTYLQPSNGGRRCRACSDARYAARVARSKSELV